MKIFLCFALIYLFKGSSATSDRCEWTNEDSENDGELRLVCKCPAACPVTAINTKLYSKSKCACSKGYYGDPCISCRKKCAADFECPKESPNCFEGKCISICSDNVCGTNALCRVEDNSPVCSCPKDMLGDPFIKCSSSEWVSNQDTLPEQRKLICILTSEFSEYETERISGLFLENRTLCTHVLYDKADLDLEAGILNVSTTMISDYNSLYRIKEHDKNVKIIISVNCSSGSLDQIAFINNNATQRQKLIQLLIKQLRHMKADGISLQYASQNSICTYQFFQDLKTEIELEAANSTTTKLILTIYIVTSLKNIGNHDLKKLSQYFDWLQTLSFNYESNINSEFAIHGSPLYGVPSFTQGLIGDEANVNYTINMLLAKGVPSEKLVLPISPLIAQKTLKDPSAPELGASAQLQMLMVTPLILGFYQFCEKAKKQGAANWTIVNAYKSTVGSFMHTGDQWVPFVDEDDVKIRVRYALDKHLGGIVFDVPQADDFKGNCYPNKTYPLISAIKKTLTTYNSSERKPVLQPGFSESNLFSVLIPSLESNGENTLEIPYFVNFTYNVVGSGYFRFSKP